LIRHSCALKRSDGHRCCLRAHRDMNESYSPDAAFSDVIPAQAGRWIHI
jgi:hypothetical protein